jgi:hypothetical protein
MNSTRRRLKQEELVLVSAGRGDRALRKNEEIAPARASGAR